MSTVTPNVITRSLDVTIATSAQLSTAADLGDRRLQAVLIPSNTEGSAITFQVSIDGSTFYVLYDTDGAVLSYPFTDPGAVIVDAVKFLAFRHVKVDSGINQSGAIATLTLVAG